MTTADSAPADDFYARTVERVQRIMIVISIAVLVTAQVYFGWRISLGVAVGCIIGYVNFRWLKSVVAGLADLAAQSGTPASSRGGIVMRFLVRYFLMAILGFVILTVSRESLYGFFAGLLVTVAALLCEAAYEGYKAVVSGR